MANPSKTLQKTQYSCRILPSLWRREERGGEEKGCIVCSRLYWRELCGVFGGEGEGVGGKGEGGEVG